MTNGGLGAAAIPVVVVPLFGGIPESVKQERGVWEAWWREVDIYFGFVSVQYVRL
jgi:hypothetical protein